MKIRCANPGWRREGNAKARPLQPRSFASARRALLALAALCAAALSTPASATHDLLEDLLPEPGGAALGAAVRVQESPYRDGGMRNDFLPLYLYESEHVYLHAYRLGLKFDLGGGQRADMFITHRFEGFPVDNVPATLAGMTFRQAEADAGVSYELHSERLGHVFADLYHDVSGLSGGSELQIGISNDWRRGGLQLAPVFSVSYRDARLNNYYYGVLPEEATADRPAYDPGSGVNWTVGVNARYDLTERWRLVGGVSVTEWSTGVRHSPIVDDRPQFTGFAGFAYDLSPNRPELVHDGVPLIVKYLHGKSTDCNLLPIMEFRCTSVSTEDHTTVDSIEIGRPFIERLNGWPLDFVGYIGLLHHNERGLQDNFWQVDLYMKPFFYGFPWSEKVMTRIGFGMGMSYAQKIPFVEAQSQAERGRNTSKLLQYLDPTIDVSVGDVVGARKLHDTYFGFGVSHRSGIFGTSQLFGDVNGGSNYIYTYIETRL